MLAYLDSIEGLEGLGPVRNISELAEGVYLLEYDGNRLSFYYEVPDFVAFHFSTLAEVGALYQPYYADIGPTKTVQVDEKPYVVTERM